MNVTVQKRSPVDFDLEIHIPADELEERTRAALREQRKKMNLKGFRPGKVPVQMVRKMHGPAIAGEVAQEVIGEIWRDEVAENDEFDVLGAPRLVKLDFDIDRDLDAVLRFGVRPEFELEEKYEQTVRRLARTVSEADVVEEIERRLLRQAEVVPTELPADDESMVVVDLQLIDKESGTPIVGQREVGRELDLTDERLRSEMRDAIVGKKAGDAVRVDLPHHHGPDEGHDHDDHVDRYMVTVQQVRHRIRPELDEDFIREQTAGQKETAEDYHEMVRSELEQATNRLGEDFLREEIVRTMLEAHDFPVPESLVESVIDDMEEELAKQAGRELPPEFERDAFRDSRREAAESQARWILIQDKIVEEADLTLREEDLEAEFERLAASGPGSPAMIKQFLASQPQILEGIKQQIMTRRLFDALAGRFEVVNVSPDELEQERETAS
jgi:trigger factor